MIVCNCNAFISLCCNFLYMIFVFCLREKQRNKKQTKKKTKKNIIVISGYTSLHTFCLIRDHFLFLVTSFRAGFFIRSLLFKFFLLSLIRTLSVSVWCLTRRVPVFSQVHLRVLGYRWPHNPPAYWRTVTLDWYWEPTPFRNSISRVPRVQEHVTTPD